MSSLSFCSQALAVSRECSAGRSQCLFFHLFPFGAGHKTWMTVNV